MFSSRTPRTASFGTRLALLLTTCAALVLPANALAAPEGGEEPPTPQLAFEPGNHDFGQQPVYSNTQTTLQLRNVGAAAAQVHSLEITGPGSGVFWTGGSDCYGGRTLNPGEACSVQVYFGPNDALPFSAQLRANSELGTSFSAELSGEGGRAVLAPASDPTNFGAVQVGTAGVTKTIDVTNVGNMSGGVFIAVISGGAVGSFRLLDENCTGISLTPAATCNLQVTFKPLSTGAKTARLSLFGESDGGTQISLTGVGLEPELAPFEGQSSAEGAKVEPRHKHRLQARPRRGKRLQRKRRQRAAVAQRQAIR